MTASRLPRRVFALIAGAAAGALMLAACAGAPQPAQSSPAPEAVVESTSTPTSAPTPSETGRGDQTVDFDGVGSYVLGGAVEAVVGAVSAPYSVAPPSACPNPQTTILESDSSPTIWLQDRADTGYIDVVAVGADVPGDPREAASPRTEFGIAIGSSLSDVEAAYPDGVLESNEQGEPDRFVVSGVGTSGEPRYLVFAFHGDGVQTIFVQAASDKVWEFCA